MAKSPKLKLTVLPGAFCIHRLAPTAAVTQEALAGEFSCICRTAEELSIVCADTLVLDSDRRDAGWSCIKVVGPLDFGMTGILADLSTLLANAGISIFAVSTFDTDYILVKTEKLARAVAALENGAHIFV